MVKTANLRNRDDRARFWSLDNAGFRAVLLQCQVCSCPMIIAAERLQMMAQAAFVEDDDVIQTLPTDGADDAFDVGSLPWRTWR